MAKHSAMVNQQFAIAVHILVALAYNKKTLMNSDSLAKSASTNPVVIRRLLSQLAKSKLVTTRRGKSGGVELAKEPSQINLKEIYLALSPSEPIARRNKMISHECPVSCLMNAIMSTLAEGSQKSIQKYLESQKLSVLVKNVIRSQKHA